ncbi:MAG: rhodanese-like domain-containing protein [Lachnospiraceae bacterium]|nr:rhodanese-like domain-containing protein [Lachnospiraceae bacterium]
MTAKVGASGDSKQAEYTSISMEEAKKVFETPGDYIILDVRRADEYAKGHIPGAINVANEDIGAERPAELPDLNRVIFVYCRSGMRAKEASAKLAALGYTDIYEFGGIKNWDGEIEK